MQGMVDMFVLGSHFSPSCRVFIRQVTMGTEVNGVFGAPDSYTETPSVIWQREAQIKKDDLTQVSLFKNLISDVLLFLVLSP